MNNFNSCTDSMESSNARFALTALRATFQPIPGIATNTMDASLPRYSRVAVIKDPQTRAVTLQAWIDADPSGPADYQRANVQPAEYILGGGSNA